MGTVISFIKNKISGNGLEKTGGILPFLPLILAGIGAAGATAGGVAGAVNAANQKAKNDIELAEQLRHNKEVERLTYGHGVYLNPYKGKSLKDILTPIVDKIDGIETEGKKSVRKTIKALSPFFKIFESKDGNGLYLSPKA